MTEYLTERNLEVTVTGNGANLISELESGVLRQLAPNENPVRLAVTSSDGGRWQCDVGVLVSGSPQESIFRYRQRTVEDQSKFNVVMLVPTGIGAEIGGHAGDATPAATVLASVCDTLITHPNVLNAADIIQVPANALYVEGSVVASLLMGNVGLNPVRSNRVLTVVQRRDDRLFTDAAINAVNAARATYGLTSSEIVEIDPEFRMTAEYSSSGAAVGRVDGIHTLWDILDTRLGDFDAIAVSSVIDVPTHWHRDYYEAGGRMVNPWGGVEAMLTHAISSRYGVPAAHSPMLESREVADLDLGVVDPRMAAEVVSVTFLQCILRGLQFSPKLVPPAAGVARFGVESVSCLVIPEGCLGLPTLAALGQGIPVIAVAENKNIMRNALEDLPWRPGQYFPVANYWEAAGVVAALRVGVDPASIRRFPGLKDSFSTTSGEPVASETGRETRLPPYR